MPWVCSCVALLHRRNTASIARFQREIEAVGKLDHPNVVRAFDAGEDGDMHYLAPNGIHGRWHSS
jgi:hypothetical protein